MVGEGPCGSEKWTCWSGCGPKTAWGLPMSRAMHWGEWPQHLQEAQEQPCSEGQVDDPKSSENTPWSTFSVQFCTQGSVSRECFEFQGLEDMGRGHGIYKFFGGKVMCKSSNNSLQDGDKTK